MTRRDCRNAYPFHYGPGSLHNVRAGIPCCLPRRPLPRRTMARRVADALRRLFA